jgi:ATP-dependent Lon protease
LAIQDRFHYYVPGWEIPKAKEESLTKHYGLIIEYLAASFHHLARKTNRFAYAKAKCQLGEGYAQRDQTAVLKTVCALLKLLHPDPASEPTPAELDEYLTYAVEGRRRVKEQLNKLKPDDEFAQINLSFIDSSGQNRIVYCPESKDSPAVQRPARSNQLTAKGPSLFTGPGEMPTSPPPPLPPPATKVEVVATAAVIPPPPVPTTVEAVPAPALTERHYRIHYGAVGYSYQSIMGVYLPGAKEIVVEDAYIRHSHQIRNFLLFCELAVRMAKPEKIKLITKFEDEVEKAEAMAKLAVIGESLKAHDVEFTVEVKETLHDRHIILSNGWTVKIGRGFDIYQRPDDWLHIGASDMDLRPCMETSVDIFRSK